MIAWNLIKDFHIWCENLINGTSLFNEYFWMKRYFQRTQLLSICSFALSCAHQKYIAHMSYFRWDETVELETPPDIFQLIENYNSLIRMIWKCVHLKCVLKILFQKLYSTNSYLSISCIILYMKMLKKRFFHSLTSFNFYLQP